MPVYGEESAVIEFSKGLWFSDTPDIPEGFCRGLENLILNDVGSLVVRPSIRASFGAIDTAGIAVPDVDDRSTFYSASRFINGSFLGTIDDPNNVPTYIEPNLSTNIVAVPYSLGTIHPLTGAAVRHQKLSEVPGSNWVMYRDRTYVWTYNDGIKQVVGWNVAAPTNLTETNIAGSPTVAAYSGIGVHGHLIVHKDRLFLFTQYGRVYYTETAAVGGYPETWNIGTNFFGVPVVQICNVFVKDDDVFIWTTKGVWKLQVYGPPESWILKNVLSDISVQDSSQVCLNRGVFYYTARKSVFAFNGVDNVDISKPIKTHLEKCHGLGVFVFENGVIVCAEIYDTIEYAPATFNLGIESTKLLYFDATSGIWSEISISGQNGPIITGSFVDVRNKQSDSRPTTYISMLIKTTAYNESYAQQTFFVSRLDVAGDSVTNDYAETTLPIEFSVETNHWVGNSHKEKRIKYGYARLYSTLDTVEFNVKVDGIDVNSPQELEFDEFVDDHYYNQALKMPGFARRLAITVSGEVAAADIGSSIVTTPFILTDITLIYNTGRNEEKTSSG